MFNLRNQVKLCLHCYYCHFKATMWRILYVIIMAWFFISKKMKQHWWEFQLITDIVMLCYCYQSFLKLPKSEIFRNSQKTLKWLYLKNICHITVVRHFYHIVKTISWFLIQVSSSNESNRNSLNLEWPVNISLFGETGHGILTMAGIILQLTRN